MLPNWYQCKRINISKPQDPRHPDTKAEKKKVEMSFPEDRYAGQILAEMLSIVCHKKLIEHPQEVPRPNISK